MNNVMEMQMEQPVVQGISGASWGRLVLSGVYSLVAVVICAVLWGAVAYFTNTIFLLGAIAVGFVITFTLTSAYERVTIPLALLLILPAITLTVISVLLGDYIYYTLVTMQEFGVSFGEAAVTLAENFVELERSEGLSSLVFAGLGALIGFYNAIK